MKRGSSAFSCVRALTPPMLMAGSAAAQTEIVLEQAEQRSVRCPTHTEVDAGIPPKGFLRIPARLTSMYGT